MGGRINLRVGGVLPGTAASFQVRAFNPLAPSKWTGLVSAKTPLLNGKLKPLHDEVDYGATTVRAPRLTRCEPKPLLSPKHTPNRACRVMSHASQRPA